MLSLFLLLSIFIISTHAAYSINFFRKINIAGFISTEYEVKVNGAAELSDTIEVTFSGSGWQNFDAIKGDVVNVLASTVDIANRFGIYYLINDSDDGGGFTIYDSRSTTFTPKNNCVKAESPCPLFIGKSTLFDWGFTRATIYFNGVPVVSEYDGDNEIELTVKYTDIIEVQFAWVQGDANSILVGYYLSNEAGGVGDSTIIWLYNSYGTNTIISNPFPISSPFGGGMYPISPEQESTFAQLLSSGGRTRWI